MHIKQILLITDLSDDARGAYHCAADLAAKCGARLHLVYFAGAIPGFLPTVSQDTLFDALETALTYEAKDHPAFHAVEVVPRLQRHRWTRARHRELERELAVDLIVTSPQAQSGVAKTLRRNFADRIVRHSSVPVLLFRPGNGQATLDPRMIVVPHDFYERPGAVLPPMRWLDGHFRSTFRFLFVYDPIWPSTRSIYGMQRQFAMSITTTSQMSVEDRFARIVDSELYGLDVTLETAQGFPSEQIVQRVNSLPADLVLLARRDGMSGVSRRIMRESRCSVLAVPAIDARSRKEKEEPLAVLA